MSAPRPWLVLAMTFAMTAEFPTVESARDALDGLRAVMVAAGCPEASVRSAMRWAGAGRPAELTLVCLPTPDPKRGDLEVTP